MANKKNLNSNLHKAYKAKDDEFYTQISDIEKEVKHYKEHFKNKVVFCNCDDPEWSNFWKYFSNNFEHLGLKKLISTHYKEGSISYKLEMNIHGEIIKTDLEGDGDFRSIECVELLKEADIVATNPPFSLFREYIQQLIDHNKKILVIGNNMSIGYKEIFKYIKANKLWMGVSPRSMDFILPNGVKKPVNANWYTNLSHKKRNEEIILYKTYDGNEIDYPKYDNKNAIEVSKIKDIPLDYDGVMGVPITFMDKYNPNQFQIVGFRKGDDGKDLKVDGKDKFSRILIKNRKIQNMEK